MQIKAACARIFVIALDGKCETFYSYSCSKNVQGRATVHMGYLFLFNFSKINCSDSLYAGSTDINFVTTDLMECDLCAQARKARGM